LDRWRRYRLDQADATGQLRAINPRRAFSAWLPHIRQDESECYGRPGPQHHLHQRRSNSRWRRLVEGMTDEPPASALTARRALDSGDRQGHRQAGGSSNSRFTRLPRNAQPSTVTGRPGWRPISAIVLGRRQRPCARLSAFNWSGGSTPEQPWDRRHGRVHGATGKVRRDPWPCCLLWLSHGDYFRTGSRCSVRFPIRRASSRKLVPQRRERQVLWPATAKTCAC